MNEVKPQRKQYGLLIRTSLSRKELAELSTLAKKEGRSRSNFVTQILKGKLQQPEAPEQ